jgi:hypothetical protein
MGDIRSPFVYFRLAALALTCNGHCERRHLMELAIGIIVVVGIILLLGRLADWLEGRSFVLWLVVYLVAGGLTIVLLGTARTAGH